jgi:hypothetical protein
MTTMRHHDPHALNQYCTRRVTFSEATYERCGQCDGETYSCECGAYVDPDGREHRCTASHAWRKP